uniref:Uncharacterized protein n=1 Tax=Daucus carota subsp. sativus TaxID=79200 RepID=A0A175YP65_DAUCS
MEKARVNKIISLLVLVMVCDLQLMRTNASDLQCKSDGDCKYYAECVDGKMRCVKGECRCIHFGIPGPQPSHGFDDDKKVNNEVNKYARMVCANVKDMLVTKMKDVEEFINIYICNDYFLSFINLVN